MPETLTDAVAGRPAGSPPPAQPVVPVAPSHGRLRPLGMSEVRIAGGFWGEKQALNGSVIIGHCRAWMDRIGWIRNFDLAAGGGIAEGRSGVEFVDSEVYKLLEAMAWELGRSGSADLEAEYEALVSRVAAAQEPDGYLHTAFGRAGQRPRYSDLEWGHELYCFGHLLQAAVARLRTGHDDVLPQVARRLVAHLGLEFGAAGRQAVCGHPEVETALVEFGRAAGVPEAIDLARLLVERRGHRTLGTTLFQSSEYFLDDVPVREAEVLRGHAVRALYLACGAVDVAAESDDGELLAAVERQWSATVASRTYLTGGMGAHHQNEEFGDDFELPADRSYSETCAAIGSVMLNWRLLLQTGDQRYADLLERTLLNAFIVSPREDGRAFFYANTLHQRVLGEADADDSALSERAEARLRSPWFEVSCCPTNVARTLASVAGYFATADGDGVQIHQYGDLDVRTATGGGTPVELEVRTGYPFDGAVRVRVLSAAEFALQLRIPPWASGATATLDGVPLPIEGGRLVVHRAFAAGAVVELVLPMAVRVTRASPRIDATRGAVAFERGPLVLCLESTDLGADVDLESLGVDTSSAPSSTSDGAEVSIRALHGSAGEWPYGSSPVAADGPAASAVLRPYFRWGNRGPSTMRVWIPELVPGARAHR